MRTLLAMCDDFAVPSRNALAGARRMIGAISSTPDAVAQRLQSNATVGVMNCVKSDVVEVMTKALGVTRLVVNVKELIGQ
jgi:hypothetical protein